MEEEKLESLLVIVGSSSDDRRQVTRPTQGGAQLGEEVKRVARIAGPMLAVMLSLYFLQIVAVMMVGHLGELALSSTAIAISFGAVTGFSPIVSTLQHLCLSFTSDVSLTTTVNNCSPDEGGSTA